MRYEELIGKSCQNGETKYVYRIRVGNYLESKYSKHTDCEENVIW